MLDGDTVLNRNALNLKATWEYDFSEERTFSCRNLSMDEMIHHLDAFCFKIMVDSCI